MKKQFLLGACLGLTLTGAVWAQAPAQQAKPAPTSATMTATKAPKLVLATREQNLGEIKRGHEAKFVFKVKNEGTDELEIRNVAPACGCTAGDFTKLIQPGQEGQIILAVNTTNFSGAITKTADVFTNDPEMGRFTLVMHMVIVGDVIPRGKIIGKLMVEPTGEWHASTPLGASMAGTFVVSGSEGQAVQIKQATVNSEAFKLTVTPLEAGKRYQLSFASKEGLALGSYRGAIKVETDSAETPVLELPVSLNVVAPITANPAKLMLDNVFVSNPENDISGYGKFVWVRFARGEGLQLTNLSSDLPFIKTKVESVEGNNQTFLLRVTFSEKPAVGTHTGKIKVETNNKDVPVLEIPVTVVAK